MVGYDQTKIYKVVCNITGQVYISHTTKKYLSQRLSYHLSKFKLYRDGLLLMLNSVMSKVRRGGFRQG